MIIQELREHLSSLLDDATILDNPSFDASIIGTTDNAIVYNMDYMIEELANDNNITFEEALEFISYNTLRAIPYMGANKPIIIFPLEE